MHLKLKDNIFTPEDEGLLQYMIVLFPSNKPIFIQGMSELPN